MKEISKQNIFEILDLIAKQNLLTLEDVKKIISDSILKSFYLKFDPDADLELIFDENKKIFKLINKSKLVVSDSEHNQDFCAIEISLSEAQKIDPKIKEGDLIEQEVDLSLYKKQQWQQIQQLIIQAVRESKKEAIWEKHKSLKGEMIDVTVSSITPSFVIFNLDDGTTAFMPSKFRNEKIGLKIGERTKVFVEDVLKETKDSQIIVSNGSKVLIKRVLEIEVPEIAQNIIEIVNIARIPGDRSKIAVKSNVQNVEPVGSIIGANGTRIESIISKLGGEKIDVILWNEDLNLFIVNALSPAKVISVIDKKDENGDIIVGHKIAITPNRHQTLAIGKAGLNARLAVELVNCRIDVLSYDEAIAKNIDIIWNGNISKSELEAFEINTDRQFNFFKNNRNSSNNTNNNPRVKTSNNNKFSTSFFDDAISSFNEELGNTKEMKENDFKIDDSIFSEEELRQMEANFELDDDFTPSNEDKKSDF